MSLIGLSGDVLEVLFEFLGLPDLVQLYLIGNRPLYWRICTTKSLKKCVVSMPFPSTSSTVSRPSIEFLSLRSFSQLTPLAYYPCLEHLHLDFSIHDIVLDRIDSLLSLPLRYLCLKMSGAWLLLFDPVAQRIRALNHLFPRLETLIWADLKPIDMRICTDPVLEQLAHRLPSTLSRLSLGTFSRYPYALVRSLPSHLSSLSIMSCHETWDSPLCLPSQLTEAVFMTQTPFQPEATLSLPPSLQSLTLQRLPNVLPYVNSSTIVFTAGMVLPSQLTSLALERLLELNENVILSLPPTLLKLLVPYTHSVSEEHLFLLPAQLQVLCLGSAHASSDAFSKLPRTISWLDCAFSLLPDATAALASLPPGLTKFWWKGETGLANHEIALPRHLRHLCFHRCSLSNLAALPPQLETFIYKNPAADKFTKEQFESMPKTIKLLKLTDMQFEVPPSTQPMDNVLLFPSNLTVLKVEGERSTISEKTMMYLPRTLTNFRNRSGVISASCLQHLPPDLIYFSLKSIIIDNSVSSLISQAYELVFGDRSESQLSNVDNYLQSKLRSLPCIKISSKGELKLTTEDFMRAVQALVPRRIKMRPCNFYTFHLTPSLLQPLSHLLSSLDTTLTSSILHGEPLSIYSQCIGELVNMSARTVFTSALLPHVPHLKTLIMNSAQYQGKIRANHVVMSQKDLFQLPTSLTRLEIDWVITAPTASETDLPKIGALITDSLSGYMPPEDERTMKETERTAIAFSRLPNLTHLTLHRSTPLISEFLPKLPSGMRELRLHRCMLREKDFALLPRQLSMLVIRDLEYNVNERGLAPFHLLPNGITNLTTIEPRTILEGFCTGLLHVPSSSSYSPGTSCGIAGFVTRTNSRLKDWEKYTAAFVDNWPQNMKDCPLDGFHFLDNAIFSKLPKDATSISLLDNYNITLASIPSWPHTLTSLKLGSLLFTKADLEALSTQIDGYDDLERFDTETIKDMAMNVGPKSLAKIELAIGAAPHPLSGSTWVLALPKRLKLLQLQKILRISDSDIGKLPNSLETLRLPSLQRIASGRSGITATLPPHLVEFSAPQLQLQSTDIAMFEGTPNLTSLDLSALAFCSDEMVKILPKGLTQLILSDAIVNDSCLELMPRTLTILKLGRIRITGAFSCPGSTVDIFALIAAAEDRLPTTLTCQPTLIWEFEPSSFLRTSLSRVCCDSTLHIMLPCETVETLQALNKKRNGIAYRVVQGEEIASMSDFSSSLGPRSSFQLLQQNIDMNVLRWIEYSIVDPLPPHLAKDGALKPLRLFWASLKHPHPSTISLHHLPSNLKSFVCHNFQYGGANGSVLPRKTIGVLPSGLTRLSLFSGQEHALLAIQSLPYALPNSITHLELTNMDGFTIRLDGRPFPLETLETLPPHITRLSINSVLFTGQDAMSLLLAPDNTQE